MVGGVVTERCLLCDGRGLLHDPQNQEDDRWDDICQICDGLGHVIIGPDRAEWMECVHCRGSRISSNGVSTGPCGPCDGRGRVLRTRDRTMRDDSCYNCGGNGCNACGYSGLFTGLDRPETSRSPEKVTYTRHVTARTEIQLAIDVWIEKKSYEDYDHLVFETKLKEGKDHPWPKDVLRIDVPSGTRLVGNGSYVLEVPATERVVERLVQVKEYVDEGRNVMAFLVFFYSLLRWTRNHWKPEPTTDSELRFSLLELD